MYAVAALAAVCIYTPAIKATGTHTAREVAAQAVVTVVVASAIVSAGVVEGTRCKNWALGKSDHSGCEEEGRAHVHSFATRFTWTVTLVR
jgi:hypothetical protein